MSQWQAHPKNNTGPFYYDCHVDCATAVFSLLKAQWVRWGRASVKHSHVGGWQWGEAVRKVLAFHTEKCGNLQSERNLRTPCWANGWVGMGGREGESSIDGVERDLWEKERKRGGNGGGLGGERERGPLGEVERDPKPGHLLRGEQLWTFCPWEEGHSRKLSSSVSYTIKPGLTLTAFTLLRSAITKPIKKPQRGASTVSQSPLADLATRLIAQESTFQLSIESTSNYQWISPFYCSILPTDVVTHKSVFYSSQMHANTAHWN